MRAIGVTEFGGPEKLGEVQVETEALEPGTVRLRVDHVAVSPTDTMLRRGVRAEGPRPEGGVAVPGMDAAGEVLETGEGVTHVAPGDAVMAVVVPAGAHGAYRSDLVVPADSVTRIPSNATSAEASTLPMNGLTARLALETLSLSPGDVLAVTGAAGAFGGYMIQLAKVDGLTVVADAADKDEDLVRQLGADVIVPRGPDFAAAVRERYPDGVDGLADGSIQGAEVLDAVKDGGAVATVRGYRGEGERDLRVQPVWVRDGAERRDLLEELRELVERGAITLRVADVLPAAEAAEAHRRLEAGGVRGRIVLDLTR